MGQEYFINSQELEDKIRQLLPSQGGAGAGVDLSASTQIVPIIDLTESAEGSNVRQDLQTALSLANVTRFDISNTTTSMITSTGYWRIFGCFTILITNATGNCRFNITDGTTTKSLLGATCASTGANDNQSTLPFDFVVKVNAGETVSGISTISTAFINVSVRQIADIDGNLITT